MTTNERIRNIQEFLDMALRHKKAGNYSDDPRRIDTLALLDASIAGAQRQIRMLELNLRVEN